MNIYHFEDDLTDAILDKGYDYYLDDRVVDVYHQGDRECQVEGNDDYEVVVKLDENGEILRSHCDCPYAYGPICKHEVAAYYVLSDMLNSEGECEESNETPQLKAAKPPELKEVLQQIPKEELIGIIMDVARKDTFLRNSLLLKYAKVDEQQELDNCRRLIQSIVRKYAGRDGFIPVRDNR
ncbi:SWIM zinc finger family protein [Paenibacillus oralis]|uniref:SWIM zinc finger family protein n=1 Tax=Paenibacillus oralis TaxID=2490856 RepID=UPI001C498A6D|nr:SWIM zinc finger family protein [Paenibacillus oralis]